MIGRSVIAFSVWCIDKINQANNQRRIITFALKTALYIKSPRPQQTKIIKEKFEYIAVFGMPSISVHIKNRRNYDVLRPVQIDGRLVAQDGASLVGGVWGGTGK